MPRKISKHYLDVGRCMTKTKTDLEDVNASDFKITITKTISDPATPLVCDINVVIKPRSIGGDVESITSIEDATLTDNIAETSTITGVTNADADGSLSLDFTGVTKNDANKGANHKWSIEWTALVFVAKDERLLTLPATQKLNIYPNL